MEGWVRFHRKIEEWEWYTDPNVFRLFFHLVLKANHQDNTWRGQDVKRGQHITSINKLSEALDLSPKQIRLAMDKLKRTNEVATKGTNKNTLVTIVNYDFYQSKDDDKGKQKGEQQGNPKTNKGQTKGNKQECKEGEEGKSNIPYAKIVDYLNECTGKSFRHTSAKTKDCIQARFNEGFVLDDFKKVIDVKVKEWSNDENMNKYLRPETLFSNKFEGYLNQVIATKPKKTFSTQTYVFDDGFDDITEVTP